jgi:CRISPR-associated protein Cas2
MKSEPRLHRYAVAYDVSDDHERREVDRLLKGWGQRVQKSVFLVATTRTGEKRLKTELDKLDLKTGTVLLFRLQTGVPVASSGLPFHDPDTDLAYII